VTHPKDKPLRSCCVATTMPIGGGMQGPTIAMVTEMRTRFAAHGVRWNFIPSHGGDQAHARAELVALFQHRSGCDDLLLLDADISFPAHWLDEVLCRVDEDLVIGPYPSRTQDSWALDVDDGKVEKVEGLRMLEVAGAGLGCVRVRRHVLETLQRAFPALEYESDNVLLGDGPRSAWDLFLQIIMERRERVNVLPNSSTERIVRRRRSEDMSFFQRARRCGFRPMVLVDMPVVHDGKRGDLAAELFARANGSTTEPPRVLVDQLSRK
jgi:hypothetical protein